MPTLLKRLLYGLLTLLIIAYLTLFGLSMAERGREGRPAEPLSVAGEALIRTGEYIFDHPTTYHWHRYVFPAFELVATTFRHSAGLLLVALTGAALLGILLGTVLALTKHKVGATLMLFFSILGVSTPSFLLAMLLWVINIQMHRRLDVTALPSAGFGWDAHLIMPALVLAARPLAQITQVTYVTLSEVLEKDYIRTARAKGLKERVVYLRHAMRNALIPILTTMGASLRFSLASLPVVELFFDWPGVGLMLLEAIELGKVPLVTDLTVSLGLFFLLINSGLAFLYPLIDPQLRNGATSSQRREEMSLGTVIARMRSTVASIWEDLRHKLPGQRESESKLRPLPSPKDVGNHAAYDEADRPSQARWLLGSILRNPALIVGTLLILGLVVIAIGGERMTSANPYEIHGVMMVEGEIGAPPYPPSATFPWGTDYIGRDMRALVLAGARQTLSLAFFGMVARVILGTLLGMIAGWWHDSRVDQVIGGAIDVWAAFPVTIFAMLLIQALGIQQGMWVFVVALCIVGWGEVAQFVRGQVIAIKPQLYIEAARATGAHAYQMLMRHIIPNLLPSLLVLSAMEMGGVLMLLAELGYLNVFLGGGFKVEMIGEVIEHFSDVPEWGALLASIRQWWRSYPWMALYPGGAFFISIVACNLWAEGLRHLLMKSRINLTRFFNRYLLVALAGVAVGLFLMLRSTAPLGVYRSQARQFDAERA
ncbi:MAG: ABC transporter permease subunit, partial [Chloroflexi bacterium]|nr:ABC transporter permease subunit [Chloroflexota bacterium]